LARRPGTGLSMPRVGSNGEVSKVSDDSRMPGSPGPGSPTAQEAVDKLGDGRGLFHVIEQLAALEGALWSILDGLKSNATHVSYFCREYWGTSASHAQLSLEKLGFHERLKRQVQQACVLESLSLGVASHLCSGTMQGVSVTIRLRLRNLLYYVHENCLVLLDLVCQRWLSENPMRAAESEGRYGHCPENLNLDILVRVKRYRRLRRGEHIMALRQHNEMIANVVRQLCRGATTKRVPLSSRSPPGDRSPGTARGFGSTSGATAQGSVLSAVNEVLASRVPLDRLRASSIRSKMLQFIRFEALLSTDASDQDCPWPTQDPYKRYGADNFAKDGATIWFEPLPPMLPVLDSNPKLPPSKIPDAYTLVLDLDETLVHYSEHDGMGSYEIRPGMYEFIQRMHHNGFEIIIFTAATQDYADWVIDQIDPERLIHHRLYRQHALPWGPIFVKDLSRLGRDLDRVLIIDNVQENFMLQPHNGIFILSWYDDPSDTALFALTPLLDELAATRPKVHEILEKYKHDIPSWAGFDQYELGGDMSEYDPGMDDGYYDQLPPQPSGYTQPAIDPPQSHHLSSPAAAPVSAHGSYSQQPPQQDLGGATAPTLRSEGACHTPILQPPQPQPPQPQPQPQPQQPQQHVASVQQAPLEAHQQRSQASSYSPPSYQPEVAQGATAQTYSYHPQTLPSSYSAPRTQPSGYPPPAQAEHAAQQEVKHQQIRAPHVTQQVQQVIQRRPAPAFSGVAGPYQAAPPMSAGPPASASMWGRGAGGPCQVPRR